MSASKLLQQHVGSRGEGRKPQFAAELGQTLLEIRIRWNALRADWQDSGLKAFSPSTDVISAEAVWKLQFRKTGGNSFLIGPHAAARARTKYCKALSEERRFGVDDA